MKTELILFVQKAYRLKTSKFWEWKRGIIDPSVMQKIINGDWLAYDGFDIDVFEAFCLNLRLLIQRKDGFSYEQIGEIANSWGCKYSQYSNDIDRAIDKLQNELKNNSIVRIFKDRPTTNEDLFEVIFYGGIAHMNIEKREKFIEITEAGIFSFFVFQSFYRILIQYNNCIQNIAYNIMQYNNQLKENQS